MASGFKASRPRNDEQEAFRVCMLLLPGVCLFGVSKTSLNILLLFALVVGEGKGGRGWVG